MMPPKKNDDSGYNEEVMDRRKEDLLLKQILESIKALTESLDKFKDDQSSKYLGILNNINELDRKINSLDGKINNQNEWRAVIEQKIGALNASHNACKIHDRKIQNALELIDNNSEILNDIIDTLKGENNGTPKVKSLSDMITNFEAVKEVKKEGFKQLFSKGLIAIAIFISGILGSGLFNFIKELIDKASKGTPTP
jgi:chromosome segregation ATPase